MTRNLVATDEDDSASGPELTPEEIEALVKDARKKRKLDLKQLSSLSASKRNPFNSDSDSEDEQPLIRVRQFASHVDRESSLSSTHTTTINTPPDSQEDSDPKDTVVRRKRRRYEKMVYEGQYYRFKEGDPGVVELSFNVYVLEKDLKRIKRDSKSGPMMARLLLKAIYTKEACNDCSPTGRPSGREKIQRPPLHADGISAAHDFITKRAEKRHWPAITTTVVKKAFSDVLCEDRYTAKLFAEDKMQKEAAAASAALLAEAAGSREG
ncbi:uncharacterized protein LOC127750792 [Frankliniella occidentalis]|uniref:Uncharacterized protein LOC127750792 n=1 Tax=Frankliniella occidentalis TaxID=133901 RepID=A0A9C6XSB8_FRAOC|nr:uncharacterized protein LOC127750792 [Frankliniella occidentalis]